jgi:hypothetical protein
MLKQLGKLNTRVSLLVQLGILQAAIVVSMFFHPLTLVVFVPVSLLLIILASTFYWIDYLVRHNVTNFGVCIVIGVAALAADLWFWGYKALGIAVGVAAVLCAGNIVRKLLRPIGIEEQEANAKAYRAEAEAQRKSLSPISRDVISLLFFLAVAAVTWLVSEFNVTSFLRIILLLALFEAFQLIFHILTKQKSTNVAPEPTESAADQGGRA